MSKTQIIAELAHLTAEDLAEVRAWPEPVAPGTTVANISRTTTSPTHVRSPRPANRAHAHDFRKQVTELAARSGVELLRRLKAKTVLPSTGHGNWIASLLVTCLLAGCQPRHSSEGMAEGDHPSPAPIVEPVKPAGPLSTGPTTAWGREFTSVAAMFDVIPPAIRPGPEGNWTQLKISAANRALAREVLRHPARISARVRSIGIAPGTFNPRYTGLPRVHLAQAALGEIPVTLYAYFPPRATEQLAAINPGDEIAAVGTLSRAELTAEPNGNGVRFNVDLIDCRTSR